MGTQRKNAAVAAGLAVVALLATGCGSTAAPGSSATTATGTASPTESAASSAPALSLAELVDNWSVSGDGVEPGTIATIDYYEMRVWSECGMTYAGFRADPTGLLATSISAWSGGCGEKHQSIPWVVDSRSWATDGPDVVLHAADGSVTARLTRGGTPTPGPNVASMLAAPPTLSPDARATLEADPGLPAGLVPATYDALVGTWRAVGFETAAPQGGFTPPGATLERAGAWRGSDGCNTAAGGWNAGADGRFVATSGVMTAVGCNGAAVPGWIAGAVRAGFDGTELVLVGTDGTEVGRLVRV